MKSAVPAAVDALKIIVPADDGGFGVLSFQGEQVIPGMDTDFFLVNPGFNVNGYSAGRKGFSGIDGTLNGSVFGASISSYVQVEVVLGDECAPGQEQE